MSYESFLLSALSVQSVTGMQSRDEIPVTSRYVAVRHGEAISGMCSHLWCGGTNPCAFLWPGKGFLAYELTQRNWLGKVNKWGIM